LLFGFFFVAAGAVLVGAGATVVLEIPLTSIFFAAGELRVKNLAENLLEK